MKYVSYLAAQLTNSSKYAVEETRVSHPRLYCLLVESFYIYAVKTVSMVSMVPL